MSHLPRRRHFRGRPPFSSLLTCHTASPCCALPDHSLWSLPANPSSRTHGTTCCCLSAAATPKMADRNHSPANASSQPTACIAATCSASTPPGTQCTDTDSSPDKRERRKHRAAPCARAMLRSCMRKMQRLAAVRRERANGSCARHQPPPASREALTAIRIPQEAGVRRDRWKHDVIVAARPPGRGGAGARRLRDGGRDGRRLRWPLVLCCERLVMHLHGYERVQDHRQHHVVDHVPLDILHSTAQHAVSAAAVPLLLRTAIARGPGGTRRGGTGGGGVTTACRRVKECQRHAAVPANARRMQIKRESERAYFVLCRGGNGRNVLRSVPSRSQWGYTCTAETTCVLFSINSVCVSSTCSRQFPRLDTLFTFCRISTATCF